MASERQPRLVRPDADGGARRAVPHPGGGAGVLRLRGLGRARESLGVGILWLDRAADKVGGRSESFSGGPPGEARASGSFLQTIPPHLICSQACSEIGSRSISRFPILANSFAKHKGIIGTPGF